MRNRFNNILQKQTPILFDGAMGTMLFEHGVFINRCFDQLNLVQGDLISDIHRKYVDAGAMVIETNTFGANRLKLANFNLADQTVEINRVGAQLARKAAGDEVAVAGSVGPLGVRVEPWGTTTVLEAREVFVEQIGALIAGGVDLIALETFSDLDEIHQALLAFEQVCRQSGQSIPVIASMAVDEDGNALSGAEPEVFGPKLAEWGADIIGINCSVGPRPMLETLERLCRAIAKPLLVMPNAGLPTMVDGRMIYLCSPDYMAKFARRFVQVGARVVGGCCGTTPRHIHAMAVALRQIASEQRSIATTKKVTLKEGVEPKPPVPLAERSALSAKLARAEFVASVELTPPKGWSLNRVVKNSRVLKEAGFDVINIPDGPRASARMGSLAMAAIIEREVGIETVVHYACRDRNLVGMQSDLLGAYALGLCNILIITGDPPILGDYPQSTAVFDVDAIGLTHMVEQLNCGLDLGGQSIGKPTGFFNFVALNPTALNPEKELSRFQLKVEAGAKGAITQPVFDSEQLLEFIERIEKNINVPILAGIWPLQSLRNAEFLANEVPGVRIPESLLDRMAKAKKQDRESKEGQTIAVEILEKVYSRVQGIQVAAPFGRIKSAIGVLEAAAGIGSAS